MFRVTRSVFARSRSGQSTLRKRNASVEKFDDLFQEPTSDWLAPPYGRAAAEPEDRIKALDADGPMEMYVRY